MIQITNNFHRNKIQEISTWDRDRINYMPEMLQGHTTPRSAKATSENITIFPNPIHSDELHILIDQWSKGDHMDIQIYDVSAKLVLNVGRQYDKESKIDISGLNNSLYLLRVVKSNGEVITKKFVKL